jgi:hypothetical protein
MPVRDTCQDTVKVATPILYSPIKRTEIILQASLVRGVTVPFPIYSRMVRPGIARNLVQARGSARKCLRFAPLTLLVILLAPFAFASLGGDLNSVMTDQIRFQGSVNTNEMSSYTVHEIHPPTGNVIREYVSPAGKVFAVSWRGQWMPDMQQLLGSYFQQFSDAAKAQKLANPGGRSIQIVQPDFVLSHGGHMRAYSGKAYLPQLLPAGVTAEDIQ